MLATVLVHKRQSKSCAMGNTTKGHRQSGQLLVVLPQMFVQGECFDRSREMSRNLV